MRAAKNLAIWILACVALAGCGTVAKPEAGSPGLKSNPHFRGKAVGARGARYSCLKSHHFTVTKYEADGKIPALRVGTSSSSPVLLFEPTPGYAEGLKITGQAQGAELIGLVLVYPNGGSLKEMKIIERCAAAGAD